MLAERRCCAAGRSRWSSRWSDAGAGGGGRRRPRGVIGVVLTSHAHQASVRTGIAQRRAALHLRQPAAVPGRRGGRAAAAPCAGRRRRGRRGRAAVPDRGSRWRCTAASQLASLEFPGHTRRGGVQADAWRPRGGGGGRLGGGADRGRVHRPDAACCGRCPGGPVQRRAPGGRPLFVAAAIVSLVDPDKVYAYMITPSLDALYVSQAIVFRSTRRAGAAPTNWHGRRPGRGDGRMRAGAVRARGRDQPAAVLLSTVRP